MGCSSFPTDMESGPRGKVDALCVKKSFPTSETDFVYDFFYILNFSSYTIKKWPNFAEKIIFSETDETLGGPSTCPYDSKSMPSMLKTLTRRL